MGFHRRLQRNLNGINGRACYLLIVGAFVFLLIVGVVRVLLPSPPDPEPVTVETFPSPRRDACLTPAVFDAEAFNRTIIDNNLFRPLGWTPPRRVEPYRLIGTKLATDANTPPEAIIQTTTGEKTYIVTTGEPLDASTEVVDIRSPKQVTLLSNGQRRTLRLNTAVYLNPSPARLRSPRRMTDTPHRPRQRPAPVRSQPTPAPPAVSAPQPPDRPAPLSDWQTREGERIRLGDARLKNPQKWGLRRR